jgi:hypothetical protein
MAYIGQLGPVFNSYWARIGTNAAWMNPVVYALFAIFVLLSVSGYIAYVRRHVGPLLSALQRKQAIVLTLVTVANGILFLYWLRAYYAVAFAVTGRLLYPVHGALVIAFVGGLSLLAHQIRGVLRQALPVGVMALMGSGLLLSPITLAAIYSLPQKLKVEDLPALRGGPIDFNQTARFLGYAERAPLIKQGVLHTFTLCWQVLHPSTESFAYLLKIYSGDKTKIGERTSIPGQGRYSSNQWQAGDIFCDPVDMAIMGDLVPARTYDIALTAADSQTLSRRWSATTPNGTAIDVPIIGQVASAAGNTLIDTTTNWTAVMANFEGLAELQGVATNGPPMPGAIVRLSLAWKVTGATSESWTQYLHLIGPTGELPLVDGIPFSGQYPTWAWSAGETLVDHWSIRLPPSMPPGRYQISSGLYKAGNGTRFPVAQNGRKLPDSSATILEFQVN